MKRIPVPRSLGEVGPVPFIILAVASTGLVLYALNFPQKSPQTPPVVAPVNRTITNQTDVPSPDGSHVLSMNVTRNGNGTVNYSFVVLDPSGNKRTILTKTVGVGGAMKIPTNAWSPDNKYVFVEDREADGMHFLVLKSSGESFASGHFEDVTPLFAKAQLKLTLKDVTGWDSTDLLHVTSTNGPVKGPNFWFVVETGNFMQLY